MTENQTRLQSQIQYNVYSDFYPQDEILDLILEIAQDDVLENIDKSWVLS